MTENWVDLEHEFDLVIDYDASLWLEIPPRWDAESWSDIDSWASECAELFWRSHAQDPGESGIAFLAGTLRRCADAFAPERFDTRALLHIASPTSMPLPVFAAVRPAEEEGEREAALRALVQADDAWHDDEIDTDTVLWTATDDVGQVIRAAKDIEKLAHEIQIRIWDVDPED